MSLSIPFMGYKEEITIENLTKVLFQFPLWDTEDIKKLRRVIYIFQFPLWDTNLCN